MAWYTPVHHPHPPGGGGGGVQGCTLPHGPTPYPAWRTGTALWAQAGSQGPGGGGSRPASRPAVPVSSAVLARSAEPPEGRFCERLDSIQVQGALGPPGCTGLGGIVIRVRGAWIRDGTGRDGTGRDGTGRVGTGRDGTDAWGRLNLK